MKSKKHFFISFILIGAFALLSVFVYRFYKAKPLAPLTLESLEQKYAHISPKLWGENLDGVTTLLPSKDKKIVYLTFDACGGDYDRALVDYLIDNHIPATLFINERWIKAHLQDFLLLAQNPLFSIQNHGSRHLPLSVNGKSIYHIAGTNSIKEVYDEVMENDKTITSLTGKKPHYFRSGTAYYDEVAVSILKDLGYEIGGFDVLGDGGASFSKKQILSQLSKVRNGSILIYHFNKPKSDTYAGIVEVVPKLAQMGFSFGKLE
ncbi:polysaccharide deacetylase family protein [Helicobacter marmotae]|uniref:polysaccharide deacetylase family protein n=1 Tax=Helicobacter marmotae TaxID=152490 RepID=UPI001F19F113|nr:polysaccharide deacetylase family protein [Helicobacter marmotae]